MIDEGMRRQELGLPSPGCLQPETAGHGDLLKRLVNLCPRVQHLINTWWLQFAVVAEPQLVPA